MTEEQARQVYREAWMRYRACTDALEKERLGKIMDGCQSSIARSPDDPRWREFSASLPGYLEFWESFRAWGESAVDELRERAEREEAARKARAD